MGCGFSSTPIYLSAEEEEGMLISSKYSDG
jgi:hypothetical protein